MNVLLITFSFPPAAGVGVLRALSLAKYLPGEGIRVDVLTARNAPAVGRDAALLQQVPAAVEVHRTWTLDLPFALRKAIKRLVGAATISSSVTPAGSSPPRSASASQSQGFPARSGGNPLRRLIADLLLPDPQIGWLPFAVPAARRIIQRRQIDAVVITVPPFSSAAIVTRLRKRFPSLPIVLDFRDEWLTTTLHLVSFNNNQRAHDIARNTEGDAVRSATAVVLVTDAARQELIGRYPDQPPGKFRCIHNGFDRDPAPFAVPANTSPPARPAAIADTAGAFDGAAPITFTYLGTIYGSTDPTTFTEAVHSLPTDLRRRLQLRFIGHIEQERLGATLLTLGSTVELHGFIPQAQALRAIDSTDWLLLITHDRINVAAKFYDYLAGGKPIFAAVHPDGDVRKLLEATGTGIWADVRDPAAIRQRLEEVLTGSITPTSLAPRAVEIARFHRRALTHRYADLLRSLTAGRREQVPPTRGTRAQTTGADPVPAGGPDPTARELSSSPALETHR